MQAPLGNDENGSPLEVPATATGWLVRRHGGGRGRPGAVYDRDGRPLVVPIEATATELRGAGCGAGMYRLDAVDIDRRTLNLTAYTEITAGAEEASGPASDVRATTPTEALLLTVARSMESMQRAQIERERQSAEIMKCLIEKLAGPGGRGGAISWADLDAYEQRKSRDVKAATDAEAARRNGNGSSAVANENDDDDDDENEVRHKVLDSILATARNAAPLAMSAFLSMRGAPPEEIERKVTGLAQGLAAAQAVANSIPPSADDDDSDEDADDDDDNDDESDDEPSADSPEAKFAAAIAQLTPSESERINQLVPTLSKDVAKKVNRFVETHSVDEIVEALRAYLTKGIAGLLPLMVEAA